MEASLVSTPSIGRSTLWIGRMLSALPVLFLVFDGVTKLMQIPPVVEASALLGMPAAMIPRTGALLLACVLLYVVPRTSLMGAVLLTGYLGGAIAIQARAGAGAFPLTFPLVMGALLWTGLVLRDARLQSFLFHRS